MTAIRRTVLVGVATIIFAAACTSITLPSVPPIPSLPPAPSIEIPSFDIPSMEIPSLALPSIEIPSFDVPSIVIPSLDVPSSPIAPGNSLCALATPEELAPAMGTATVTMTPDQAGQCTVTPAGELIGVIIRNGEGETIEAAKMITTNGQDLTIGGSPAYYGELMGGILYIQKGDRVLVLQAPLANDLKDELIAVGNIVAPRF